MRLTIVPILDTDPVGVYATIYDSTGRPVFTTGTKMLEADAIQAALVWCRMFAPRGTVIRLWGKDQ